MHDDIDWSEPCLYCGAPRHENAAFCLDCYMLLLEATAVDKTTQAVVNTLLLVGGMQGKRGPQMREFVLAVSKQNRQFSDQLDDWVKQRESSRRA